MSVVDGDYWNELKKYNLTELYCHANQEGTGEKEE
jgi:tRNA acetyltransferase TAN1